MLLPIYTDLRPYLAASGKRKTDLRAKPTQLMAKVLFCWAYVTLSSATWSCHDVGLISRLDIEARYRQISKMLRLREGRYKQCENKESKVGYDTEVKVLPSCTPSLVHALVDIDLPAMVMITSKDRWGHQLAVAIVASLADERKLFHALLPNCVKTWSFCVGLISFT